MVRPVAGQFLMIRSDDLQLGVHGKVGDVIEDHVQAQDDPGASRVGERRFRRAEQSTNLVHDDLVVFTQVEHPVLPVRPGMPHRSGCSSSGLIAGESGFRISLLQGTIQCPIIGRSGIGEHWPVEPHQKRPAVAAQRRPDPDLILRPQQIGGLPPTESRVRGLQPEVGMLEHLCDKVLDHLGGRRVRFGGRNRHRVDSVIGKVRHAGRLAPGRQLDPDLDRLAKAQSRMTSSSPGTRRDRPRTPQAGWLSRLRNRRAVARSRRGCRSPSPCGPSRSPFASPFEASSRCSHFALPIAIAIAVRTRRWIIPTLSSRRTQTRWPASAPARILPRASNPSRAARGSRPRRPTSRPRAFLAEDGRLQVNESELSPSRQSTRKSRVSPRFSSRFERGSAPGRGG